MFSIIVEPLEKVTKIIKMLTCTNGGSFQKRAKRQAKSKVARLVGNIPANF
jgi:hypothetical protein